jgi:hypothetical protein
MGAVQLICILLKRALPVREKAAKGEISTLSVARHPFLGQSSRFDRDRPEVGHATVEQESLVAAAKLFSQSHANAGNRRRLFHLEAR